MGALQYGRMIYFASSINHDWSYEAFLSLHDEADKEGSIGPYMKTCLVKSDLADSDDEDDSSGEMAQTTKMTTTMRKPLESTGREDGAPRLTSPGWFTKTTHRTLQNQCGIASLCGNSLAIGAGRLVEPCYQGVRDLPGCKETFKKEYELNPISTDTKLKEDLDTSAIKLRAARGEMARFFGSDEGD